MNSKYYEPNSKSYCLRELVGDVEDDEMVESVYVNGMTYSPIVHFKDGSEVRISWDDIIDMAIQIKNDKTVE